MLLKLILEAGLVSSRALRQRCAVERSPELSEMEALGLDDSRMLAMAGQGQGKPKKQLSVAAGFAFKTHLFLQAGGRLHTRQSCQPCAWS